MYVLLQFIPPEHKQLLLYHLAAIYVQLLTAGAQILILFNLAVYTPPLERKYLLLFYSIYSANIHAH